MDKTTKYIVAVAGVVILIVIGLFFTFGRNPNTKDKDIAPSKTSNLAQYAPRDSFVTMTKEGDIVGDDKHRAVRITVTPTERRIDILAGYDGFVERSQTFDNTQAAYAEFLNALERAGFARKQTPRYKKPDGVCPLGKRYYYELDNNGDKLIDTWSASCGKAYGDFGGTRTVRKLFEMQITDYGKFVRGVRL
ncbi:hypothetical protein CR970_03820 [Candidatus Saccharibacteria bacterium]|nr:MAG: hypothetical protein CR970_03820 [Candidatus Saccharibacteria bacterium]